MSFELDQLRYKVKGMVEAGEFSLLFQEINRDIVAQILRTEVNQKEAREDLYLMSKGLTLLEMKLQEFANEITKENE